MLLRDKVTIVSGIGPGTGRAIALAFAREGARLVLAARNAEKCETVAREVRDSGGDAVGLATDVTVAEDRARLVATTLERFGRIDALVNNAFASGPMEAMIDTRDVEKSWRASFKVNVFATMSMSTAVVPAMRESGTGSIVMINSLAYRKPADGMVGYGASKAALLAATRGLATEVGRFGIRVNSVVPSHIDGPNLQIYFDMEAERQGISKEAVYRQIAELGVMDRIATIDDVANTAVLLTSDLAGAITGQALHVSCGQWMD
jgi:NAD(P)-dependent dehydrogenase (short-subunit alcohol dehydrogenase family)